MLEKKMNEEDIKLTAYRIWEEKGKPDGQDFEHWLQARNELGDSSQDGLPGSLASSVAPPGPKRSGRKSASTSADPKSRKKEPKA
jgi:hypothetical protein